MTPNAQIHNELRQIQGFQPIFSGQIQKENSSLIAMPQAAKEIAARAEMV